MLSISQHGQRATAIIKGMLERTRTSSGQREPIDLNELAIESLDLAYQGMRHLAPESTATLTTHLDTTLKPTPAIAQDLGRVLLYLCANALYAVRDQLRAYSGSYHAPAPATQFIEIQVADKGPVVPESLREKIFQPFFTTKPAGGVGFGTVVEPRYCEYGP